LREKAKKSLFGTLGDEACADSLNAPPHTDIRTSGQRNPDTYPTALFELRKRTLSIETVRDIEQASMHPIQDLQH